MNTNEKAGMIEDITLRELDIHSERLNKNNYEAAFKEIKEFFDDTKNSKKDYPIKMFTQSFTFPLPTFTGDIALDGIAERTNNNYKILYIDFKISPAEFNYPFMQDVRADMIKRSSNSHRYGFFKKDKMSGLYLMNDFLPENMSIPEERWFIVNKQD